MAKDPEIKDKVRRVEEIMAQLEADDCSLAEGAELHTEGQQLLVEVREILDDESGKIIEFE